MNIVNSGFNIHRKYAGDCAILLNWVRYHKVLYKFSIQHWQQRTPQMEVMAKSDILVSDSAYDIDVITVRIFNFSLTETYVSVAALADNLILDAQYAWLFSRSS